MLVENPHNLSRVHCASAADSDDAVGLEGGHCSRAGLCAGKARVRLYIIEGGVLDSHFVKAVGNALGIAVMEEEAVRYDEHLLLVHHVLKLPESYGQAALLEVNLFGRAEPEHILSPFGYVSYVEKMLHSYVLADGVSAP